MKTEEYKKIICLVYCDRKLLGGDHCKSCSLNPELKNNFVFGKDATKRIQIGVQTDGHEMLSKFSEEVLAELEMLFEQR